MRGSSYIPLPRDIQNRNACLNIVNTDDEKCFVWSVLASLYPACLNANRLENYKPYEDKLNTKGIDIPMKISSINKFERQNPTISVNVFGIDEPEEDLDDQNIIFSLRINHHVQRKGTSCKFTLSIIQKY